MTLKEHYGISLPKNTLRNITLKHSQQIGKQQKKQLKTQSEEAKPFIILETDGCMIPIVEAIPEKQEEDQKKHKKLCFHEARLTLAHAQEKPLIVFSGTLNTVNVTGQHMVWCINRIGRDGQTYLHCVGDGKPWITSQLEKNFDLSGNDPALQSAVNRVDPLVSQSTLCRLENRAERNSSDTLPPLNRKSGCSGGFLRPMLRILNTFRCSTWADRFCYRGTLYTNAVSRRISQSKISNIFCCIDVSIV